MKKLILSAILIGSCIAFVLFQRRGNGNTLTPPSSLSTNGSASFGSTNSLTNSQTTQSTSAQSGSSNAYHDGTYTGSVEDAFYGLVQVSVTLSNNKITNVQFLQYPNDRRESRQINSQATPWLVQEAIQAQSANVDIISGATDTSFAFIRSLKSALAQAKG